MSYLRIKKEIAMKKMLFVMLIAFFSTLSGQTMPTLTVKNSSLSVRLTKLGVDVQVAGGIAVTTMDMTFYNNSYTVLEGELNFPLGEGQNISRFAMDVNGVMRDGVVVEKNKGREVFEAIVRRGVDPGLLEMTEGNNFRARIFPINRFSEKHIIISYEEELQLIDGKFIYMLPLKFTEKVDEFNLNIDVLKSSVPVRSKKSSLKIDFRKNNESHTAKINKKNYIPSQDLQFFIPSGNEPEILIEKNASGTFFTARVNTGEVKESKTVPKTICIYQDISLSAMLRDVGSEMSFLKSLFQVYHNISVTLIPFSNDILDTSVFKIENGDWSELRQTMESFDLDGATQLGKVNLQSQNCDEALILTDGLSNFGTYMPVFGNMPVYTINSASGANHDLLRLIALRSGGTYINLNKLNEQDAVKLITRPAYKFIKAETQGISEIYPLNPVSVTDTFSFSGRLDNEKGEVTLHFGIGDEITNSVTLFIDSISGINFKGVKKIWAQKKINELNLDPEKNKKEVLKTGFENSIVTKETSLIVLETVQDHVQYEIEPTDDWKSEYDKLLAEKKKTKISEENTVFQKLKEQMNNRIIYWLGKGPLSENNWEVIEELTEETSSTYKSPFYEELIENDSLTTRRRSFLWTYDRFDFHLHQFLFRIGPSSSESPDFSENKDEKTNSQTAYIYTEQTKPEINWLETLKWEKHLRELNNGTVDFSSRNSVELQDSQAVIMGALDRKVVEAYIKRNLSKVRWCYEKEQHKKKNPSIEGRIVINFIISKTGEVSSSKINRSTMGDSEVESCVANQIKKIRFPSVKGGGIVIVNYPFIFKNKYGSKTYKFKRSLFKNTPVEKSDPETKPTEPDVLNDILQNESSENILKTYSDLKKLSGNDPVFYLKASNVFRKKGLKKESLQILSNLAELKLADHRLLRLFAYRLLEMEEYSLAEPVFKKILELRPEEPNSHRDLAIVLEKNGKYQEALNYYYKVVSTKWHRRFENVNIITLNDLNSLITRHKEKLDLTEINLDIIKPIPADIRIVLTWDSDVTDLDIYSVRGPEKSIFRNAIYYNEWNGNGPEEYLIKDAVPGEYKVNLKYKRNFRRNEQKDLSAHIVVTTNFGTENEKSTSHSVRFESQKDSQAELVFNFENTETLNKKSFVETNFYKENLQVLNGIFIDDTIYPDGAHKKDFYEADKFIKDMLKNEWTDDFPIVIREDFNSLDEFFMKNTWSTQFFINYNYYANLHIRINPVFEKNGELIREENKKPSMLVGSRIRFRFRKPFLQLRECPVIKDDPYIIKNLKLGKVGLCLFGEKYVETIIPEEYVALSRYYKDLLDYYIVYAYKNLKKDGEFDVYYKKLLYPTKEYDTNENQDFGYYVNLGGDSYPIRQDFSKEFSIFRETYGEEPLILTKVTPKPYTGDRNNFKAFLPLVLGKNCAIGRKESISWWRRSSYYEILTNSYKISCRVGLSYGRDRCTYMDKDGYYLEGIEYDECSTFNEHDFAVVKRGNRIGFINRQIKPIKVQLLSEALAKRDFEKKSVPLILLVCSLIAGVLAVFWIYKKKRSKN